MTEASRLIAHHASESFVLSKTEYFGDVHVWPERQTLDPRSWLNNFTSAERPYATHLLNVFLFFNEPLVDAMLRAGLQALSADLTTVATSLADAKARWRDFLATVIVSYVEGELPNPTDSGRTTFTRKARQVLEIAQTQIKEPDEAVQWFSDRFSGTLLLLDDFVGAGSQMTTSWYRAQTLLDGRTMSYFQLHAQGVRVVYIPLVATKYGLEILRDSCPGLDVRPVHVLNEEYSLIHEDSVLWPEPLKAGCLDFLMTASARAGIIAPQHNWKGFDDLGLGLAFWHSVPDATLPLFYWNANGWSPLVRRL